MSLALLAPAALALGLLALGPVIAHLVRRQPVERVAYGAMLLLERLRMRVERRRRLHDRALLALRMLALLCVLAALARPELRLPRRQSVIGATGRVVVVLDTSLSMDQRAGGESALARGQREAAALVRGLGDGVQVAVLAAGVPEAPIVSSWSKEHGAVATQLEQARQASGRTDLEGALTRARALLDGEPGEVVIVHDGVGPGNVAAARLSLERLSATGSTVLPMLVGVESPANLAIVDARYGDGLEGGTVSLVVQNFGRDERETPATVRLPDGAEMTVFVTVPAASEDGPGETTAAVTVPRQAAGGVASVSVVDASLPLDDTRYFHLPRVGQSRVLVVDGDPGSTPTRSEVYFLERALAPYSGLGASLDVVAPSGADRLSEGRWKVAVVANVGDPTPLAPSLVDFVRDGGALVLAVGDNVSGAVWNGALVGLLPATLSRPRDLASAEVEAGVSLSVPPPDEELFSAFAEGGRHGFARVRSRRIFAVDPYAEAAPGSIEPDAIHTLLRYDNGAPALIERRIGLGRVLLWTSTVDLGWTNFPLQSVYVPFWTRMLAWLGGEVGGATARLEGVVGEPVVVPLGAGDMVEVTGPGGERIGLTRLPGSVLFVPESPGAYAVGRADEPAQAWVAVNTPVLESDIRADRAIEAVQAEIDPERSQRRVPLDAGLAIAAALALASAAWVARVGLS
ncbi:MAG: VWA domain-containing protein [Myxococcales bacterium]|nr:VWA domain-containing protein [Myxococcales bacterium]